MRGRGRSRSRGYDRRRSGRPNGPRRELERLVSLLIDIPRAVRVSEHGGRGTCNFTVRVADDDLGKLIGRQGRTARALRTLLDARGVQDGRRYGLEIRES